MMTDRTAWLAERKKGLGATDISSLIGTGFGTPLSVYLDKTDPAVTDSDNVHPLLRMGLATEEINAREYCRKLDLVYGRDVAKPTEAVTRHGQHAFAFASLDFQRADGRPVETKYTVYFAGERWGEEMTDAVPYGYLPQTQWQMACSGSDVADISALSGNGSHRVYRIARDETLIQMLLDIGGEFWHDFVLRGSMPPEAWMHPAASELTERLIRIEKEHQTVIDDPDIVACAEQFVKLREIAKEAEEASDEIRSRLEAAMGESGKAIAGGVRLSKWLIEEKLIEPKPYIRKPSVGFRATKIKPKKGLSL
jgi:putative phage-type endonuclease